MDKKIEVKNFTKKYKGAIALDDVSIDISLGKITGILGPNGSGKTTLLKALAGFIRPDKGDIILGDDKINKVDKKNIAYLPDESFLFNYQNIKEIGNFYKDFFIDFDKESFDKLIAYFHLNEKSKVENLSKGDYKKLALCLNLARNTDIYIFDEPMDGLDSISIAKIMDLIIDKMDDKKTFIISTHQIATIENLFDDVVFLNHGKIHDLGRAGTIRDEHGMDLYDYYDQIYLG